jgi:biotin operon repressor
VKSVVEEDNKKTIKPNITTDQAAKCLELLTRAAEPIVAANIAGLLGLPGNRETKRRHVRALIKHLRDNGSLIVANLQGGYWLTEDIQIWRDYLEGRQIEAKTILGKTGRQKKILRDKAGQEFLFVPNPVCICL